MEKEKKMEKKNNPITEAAMHLLLNNSGLKDENKILKFCLTENG